MGITLYRPGNNHTVNGVKCQLKVFNEYSYKHYLDNGWFLDPADCYPKDDLRETAKKLGIRNWHNKKLENLQNEVEECQNSSQT